MKTITADDIIYIKPRNNELLQNELKASFEYNGGHGSSSFFVTVVISDAILGSPELQSLGPVDTVKFEQQPDESWNVVFSDSTMTKRISFLIYQNEMEMICERNHIRLVHV